MRLGGLLLLACASGGCERGCARDWLDENGGRPGAPSPRGSLPLDAVDCPDGLARCESGVVSASRMATVPARCHGPPSVCECPWDPVATCDAGCTAEGVEVVVERGRARPQLCAPVAGTAPFAVPRQPPAAAAAPCDEGERYECRGAAVIECASNTVVATCLRGCDEDGGAIDDDGVNRVAAFAILCSR